jgi:uncharacterized membrane protein YoaK (UPF0700 family)
MTLYSRGARLQRAGAIFLALVAGYLDGYGFLFLKTYVSFMSGNTTNTGVMIGGGHFHAAFSSGLAVVCFVTGVFCGNLLNHCGARNSHRISFLVIAGTLATVAGLEWNGLRYIPVAIALLCLAMGMVNPALTKIGAEPVSLTFVTGTLNRLGGHLASAAARKPVTEAQDKGDSHLGRARIDASIWFGFISGATLSGMVDPRFRGWALLPPCVVMLMLTLFTERRTPLAGNPASASAGAKNATAN